MSSDREPSPAQRPPARVRVVGQLISKAVARFPALWPLMRGSVARFFDRIAAEWGTRAPEVERRLAQVEAAVEKVDAEPARILDLGTGTGVAAVWLARRFPNATVLGIDISERMIEEARRAAPPDLADRLSLVAADVADAPFDDHAFDLVVQLNVPVFFDPLARLLAPGGHLVIVTSLGASTPFYTPEDVIRRGLAKRGIEVTATGEVGPGTYLVARNAL